MPGIFLVLLGLGFTARLASGNFQIGGVEFNVGTLAVACMTVIVGFQLVAFAFFTKVFAIAEGLLPDDPKLSFLLAIFTLEKGILLGLALLLTGMVLLGHGVWIWRMNNYGLLDPSENLRRLIPAVTFIVLGVQGIFSSFFLSALGLKTARRKPPGI
jgi:hypothetical protein